MHWIMGSHLQHSSYFSSQHNVPPSNLVHAMRRYDAQYRAASPNKRPWNHGHHRFRAALERHLKQPQKKQRSAVTISQARLAQLSQIPKHRLAQSECF